MTGNAIGKDNLGCIRIVERAGWCYAYTKGNHRRFRHPTKPGKVTIPGKPREDAPRPLWAEIMRQAGLRERYQ